MPVDIHSHLDTGMPELLLDVSPWVPGVPTKNLIALEIIDAQRSRW